jgi:hypothetical protein
MAVSRWKAFTLGRLIFGDMLLNWVLGVLFTFLPNLVERVIAVGPLLPPLIWRVIGVIFLLFAAWQTWIVVRRDIGPVGLILACDMAWVPVVLLTIALVFMAFPLRLWARIALWIGDVYMLFLGAWYLFLARRLSQPSGQAGS